MSTLLLRLHDLHGRLTALKCFVGVLRRADPAGEAGEIGEAVLRETEATRVRLLNQPLPDEVLQGFELEVERLLAQLARQD